MLADGAVMHLLDYLNLDCPENFGTYVTVEALGRQDFNYVHIYIVQVILLYLGPQCLQEGLI